MKIVWTQTAIDRAIEIHDYIQKDRPASARKWVEAVIEKTSKLSALPKVGRKVPETNLDNMRELILGNYRIIYKVTKDAIHLMTIRHFKQMLPVEEILK
jgi:toxin ParE1/3/4